MWKFVVGLLACFAALAIVVHFVGGSRMATTALNVPGTEHTPAFGLTWTVCVGAVIAFGVWRILKGK